MPNKKTKKGKERLDKFYHLAKDQGYRARSAFKLIQLAKKNNFLSKSKVCLDLCAAPGGWSQVAQRNMPVGSKIVAIDLAPIKPIPGVTCIQSDITTEKCRQLIRKELHGASADVVLHDGAPNVGTSWNKDAFDQAELTLHALRLACDFLRAGGVFVSKVFRSKDYNSLLWVFNQLFNKVEATKPTASRNVSAEIFVICIGLKEIRSRIDSKFFDPKWVFMETLDETPDEGPKKPGAALSEHFRKMKKKHRDGYEEGDDNRIVPAHDFIASDNPAEILIKAHKLNLEAPGCEPLAQNPLTTKDIVELCSDLKVLGKADLSQLLKWRMKILREQEKKERELEKKSKEDPTTLALQAKAKVQAAQAAAKKAVDRGLAPDLDSAIAQFLDGDVQEAAGEAEDAPSDSEDEAADDRLEQELKDQIDKRRKEDRKDAKKMMDRQRKQEWRKKMSLVTGKGVTGDQPELFRVTNKAVEALEDASAIPHELISEEEPSDAEFQKRVVEDSDTSDHEDDDEMDRLARMEVDLALDYELRKAELVHKKRNATQRTEKAKKETRRQRVVQAWSQELTDFADAQQGDAQQKALGDEQKALEEEDDDSEDDLAALRKFQDLMDSGGSERIDGAALEALAEGAEDAAEGSQRRLKAIAAPDEDEEDEQMEAETIQEKRAALEDANVEETALVPHEEELRGEQRARRWFSQDIFSGLSKRPQGSVCEVDSEDSDAEEGEMRELSDAQLPKLPLTDKAKRKLERQKKTQRLEKLGIKPKSKPEEEERGNMEVAPMEPPKPLVPQKPSDPRELAETLAIGALLVDSKKSRMDLLDSAYNRYTFEPNEALPVWFLEDEDKYNKPELPISKEQMNQFRQRLAEISRRPIRKVVEARARKKKRMAKKLEKLRSTAMSLTETSDMSEHAKARQMRKAVSKLAKQDQRAVTTVAIKKGGGGHKLDKKKVPKGAKVKTVDRRMKADLRGEKKAKKRNPGRFKLQQKKMQQKINKGNRRGKGDKGQKTGGKKRKHGGD